MRKSSLFICCALLTACQRETPDQNGASVILASRSVSEEVVVSQFVRYDVLPPLVEAADNSRVTARLSRALQVPDPPFTSTPVATFNEPWAMTFLPDGRLLLTEKSGKLRLVNVASGQVGEIIGVPTVAYGGQGD